MIATYGSLFTGIGGLDLAVEHVTGARCVWQAERDPFRRSVLARHWPDATRWLDVAHVGVGSGWVDLICGGFVCTDISSAGKRAGIAGERSGGTWGEFRRILDELRPEVAFIENVAALRSRGLDVVLADLAALGFDAEWTTLRASEVGAPHDRNRIWILAYADRERLRQLTERDQRARRGERAAVGGDPPSLVDRSRETVADADHDGRGGRGEAYDHDGRHAPRHDDAGCGARVLSTDWPPGRDASADTWAEWLARNPGCEPGIRRAPDGVPGRVVKAWKRERRERLAALGDAASPQQAARAMSILIERAAT